MITVDNYITEIKKINFSKLPEVLIKGHQFVERATALGSDWSAYHSSDSIKKTIDIYLRKLNEFADKSTKRSTPKKEDDSVKERKGKQGTVSKKSGDSTATVNSSATKMVERTAEELKFIRRFINLDGKTKTKEDILRFINSLQKAILEKRIRKTSPYAEQVTYIQSKLIDLYNKMKGQIKIELRPETHEQFKELLGSEKVMRSVNFIKSYINLNGKTGVKKKADQLLKRITSAVDKMVIPANDPYIDELTTITRNLETFLNTPSQKILSIEKNELNGLEGKLNGYAKRKMLYDTDEKKMKAIKKKGNIITFKWPFHPRGTANKNHTQIIVTGIRKERSGAIKIEGRGYDSDWYDNTNDLFDAIDWEWMEKAHTLDGCACHQLNGPDEMPQVMNSMDFANMEFSTLGLKGKWRELIGDPSTNFTAMVFGLPKMGKSYLCVEFAGYLARNHGKVLYVAKEEGLDYTLQQKLKDKSVAHTNLDVAATLPDNLHQYDFIFLDSVNKLELSPEDLTRLRRLYPTKSFIFIFQSTKQGKFRGANTFQHDVDIIIEVPERGKAVQMGRFNQGGEIDIF